MDNQNLIREVITEFAAWADLQEQEVYINICSRVKLNENSIEEEYYAYPELPASIRYRDYFGTDFLPSKEEALKQLLDNLAIKNLNKSCTPY